MIDIGRLKETNVEVKLKRVQTVILTTISNLLYTSCITRLKINYLFISQVNYYCFSLFSPQNVLSSIIVLAKPHPSPTSAERSHSSPRDPCLSQ